MVILTAFAFLVVFSIVAILANAEDARADHDRYDNPLLWVTLGRR